MLVSTFVSNIKRKSQSSDPSITTDQITTDIINFLVDRMWEVWRKWPWSWLWVPISFQTVINQTDYSIIGSSDVVGQTSSVGGIVFLGNAAGGRFKRKTIKYYRDWILTNRLDPVTGNPVMSSGTVSVYVIIGRDAQNNILVRLWETPDSVITIVGFGKKRIIKPVVADISAGNSIQYFPDEVCDVLEEGVIADVYESMGQKELMEYQEGIFAKKIEELKGEETDDEDLDATTPLPDLILFNQRRRGGTRV